MKASHSNQKHISMNHPQPSSQVPSNRGIRFTFTLRSILVITAVMAVGATAAAHLFRVVQGSPSDVGPFALVASIAPLGLMIITSWLFRLFDPRLGKRVQTARSSSSSQGNFGSNATDAKENDDRNWYVRAIHRRSGGGIATGLMMIVLGSLGLGITRGNNTVAGMSLAIGGVVILLLSIGLRLVTKAR